MKKSKIKNLVLMAMFAAVSVVFGKFLAISIGENYRISFENLTVILSGLMFGPLGGALVGVTADLLGCLLRGYAIIPLITVAAGVNGLIPGILRNLIKGKSYLKFLSVTLITHMAGSVLIKTAALHFTYRMPWKPLLLGRVPIYLVTAAVEASVLYILYKKNVIARAVKR